jgi:hypothetical protein
MLWFKKPKLQIPWSNDFQIFPVKLDDPPGNTKATWTVPYNYHLQLTSLILNYVLPGFSNSHFIQIIITRGGTRIYAFTCNFPGATTERHPLYFSVGSIYVSNRGNDYPNQVSLPDHCYLYPHDLITIDAVTSAALQIDFSDISMTFKQWITG